MKPEDLFREGKLDEAIQMLGADLRGDPGNVKTRTSLFELLCFAGDFDRAEKQLDILADQNGDAMMAGLLYRGAINAERTRLDMFDTGKLPAAGSAKVSGILNEKPFESISDADPRIGAHLELFAGPDYMWIGFDNIARLSLQPPKRLRDLLWAPAKLVTGSSFKGQDLGEVLLPALAAGSVWNNESTVRLGRVTEWFRDESGTEFPLGAKVLLVDGEEIPLLEVRTLEITTVSAASS